MNQYEKYVQEQQAKLMKFFEEKGFEASNEQEFTEGMKKLGLDPDNLSAISHTIDDWYIRNEDAEEFLALMESSGSADELNALLDGDKTGEGFIHDMFLTVLMNTPEFVMTGNVDVALNAMGFSREMIEQEPRMKRGLELALKELEKKSDITVEDVMDGKLS